MTATEEAAQARPGLTPDEINEVLTVAAASHWDEVVVSVGDVTVSVSRPVAAPSPAAPAHSPTATESPRPESIIRAPSVGIVSWSPEAEDVPVTVGTPVRAGDVLCRVRVLDVIQDVVAECDGVVTAVFVDQSTSVEYGTPLVSIRSLRSR